MPSFPRSWLQFEGEKCQREIRQFEISSAYKETFTDGEDIDEGRSFTKIRNNNGPRIDRRNARGTGSPR